MINKIFKISNVIDCVRAIIIGIVLMVATNLVNKLRPTIGEQPAQVLTVALVIIGMVFFLVGVLMLSQITRSRDRSNDPGQFASPNIVSFIQHFPAAVISEGEKIVGWYGSMGRSDARGLGGSVLIKEKVAPENTLLATEKQFIAMQVNREDTAKLQTNGRSTVESLINIEDESTYAKKEQFAALYENSWPQIIELLRPKPLTELLTNRFQYGIPYTQVKELVFRKTFINAGVRIYLTDGSFVTYTGFAPKRIDCLLPAIAGKVRTRPAKYPLFIW